MVDNTSNVFIKIETVNDKITMSLIIEGRAFPSVTLSNDTNQIIKTFEIIVG